MTEQEQDTDTEDVTFCPVCDESANHIIPNGYRNSWPLGGLAEDGQKLVVCTEDDSDAMYVHVEAK